MLPCRTFRLTPFTATKPLNSRNSCRVSRMVCCCIGFSQFGLAGRDAIARVEWPTDYCIDGGRASSVRQTAQLAADDLAGAGQRQRIHIANLARVLVGCESYLHMVLYLASQFLARAPPLFKHQERLDDLGALRIGHANHCREAHRGMAEQAVLDRSRADPVAGAGDHIVVPAVELEIALRIAASGIAGQ